MTEKRAPTLVRVADKANDLSHAVHACALTVIWCENDLSHDTADRQAMAWLANHVGDMARELAADVSELLEQQRRLVLTPLPADDPEGAV